MDDVDAYSGSREFAVVDAEKLSDWLAGNYTQQERRFEPTKDAVLLDEEEAGDDLGPSD